MNKAICVVQVSPMRAGPSHKSEQVSQLVFGDVCEVIESSDDFIKVKYTYDDYEGWCQAMQLLFINDKASFFPSVLTDKWVSEITINHQPMMVPLGSNIGFFSEGKSIVGNVTFSTTMQGSEVPSKPNKNLLKQVALAYLNTPYQWGGRTVFGVDCSGFTQMVFKFCGIRLLRDALQQALQGEVVDFMQEVTLGDLAFFDNEEGRITHVGIMLNNNTIIHASGKVRIDTIDQAGILNRETGKRTHKLRIVKRML